MKELERLLKALANRRRLAILQYLQRRKEASVGDIAEEIHLSFKSTSRHLGLLVACDILDRDQRSSQIFYFLARSQKPAVQRILHLL